MHCLQLLLKPKLEHVETMKQRHSSLHMLSKTLSYNINIICNIKLVDLYNDKGLSPNIPKSDS